MRTHETLAIFSSPELARAAMARLQALGFPEARVRLTAACGVSVGSSAGMIEPIRAALQKSGALDVIITENARGASWFSHQQGPITGTGVEPGAGDSEAGGAG